MDLEQLLFTRANMENVEELLVTIHRCMNEVNYKDYEPHEFEKYLARFTADWLTPVFSEIDGSTIMYKEVTPLIK